MSAKSFASAALFLSDRLFAVWAKTMLFFNYLNVFLHRFWRPGQMVPFAITFDRIDAKQQFAGDGFISESLQPKFVYGFFLRRRHQTVPFVLLSQRYTFSRNKKRASALYLQGLRALIPEEMPSPGPIDSAKFRAKGGGGLGPCACRDLTRPSPLVCRHIRVMVSTDIQGADLRAVFFDRDTFCIVVANSSHPRTVPDLPDAA